MIRDEGSVYYAAVPLATAMLLTPFQARNGEWFKEVSVNWLSRWILVGIDAGSNRKI